MSILERIGHDGMPPGKFLSRCQVLGNAVSVRCMTRSRNQKNCRSTVFLISNDSKGQMCAADHLMILSAELNHPPVLVTEELKKSNKSVKRACSICSILIKFFTDIMKKQNKINERCFVLHLPLCFVRWPHISRSGLFLSCRLSLSS